MQVEGAARERGGGGGEEGGGGGGGSGGDGRFIQDRGWCVRGKKGRAMVGEKMVDLS